MMVKDRINHEEFKRLMEAGGVTREDVMKQVSKIVDEECGKVMKRIGNAVVVAAAALAWLIGLGIVAILFATAYWIVS